MPSFRIVELGNHLALRVEGTQGNATVSGLLRLDVEEAEQLAKVAEQLAALLRTRRGDFRPLEENDLDAAGKQDFPPINANGF